MTKPDDHEWHVTKPSGRAHTHGADEGRTGWKQHAVVRGESKAICGLRPRFGWGEDLFEDDMEKCARCRRKLGTYCAPCNGTGHTSTEVTPGRFVGATCSACGGSGDPTRPLVRERVEANETESDLARRSTHDAIIALRKRTGCSLMQANDAVRRAQGAVYAPCGCYEFTIQGERIRNAASCGIRGEHAFVPRA